MKPVCEDCPIKNRDFQQLESKALAYDMLVAMEASYKANVFWNIQHAVGSMPTGKGEDYIKGFRAAATAALKSIQDMPHQNEFFDALNIDKENV